MTDFYTLPRRTQAQDGAGKHNGGERGKLSSYNNSNTQRSILHPHKGYKGEYTNSQTSSSSSSPVKAKQQHLQGNNMAEEETDTSLNDTRELQDSILEFPTKNQPVIDTTLKDMLVSLRSTLHADILTLTSHFKTEMKAVNNRVTHIEHKMGEFAGAINEVIDAHNEKDDEIPQLKSKMADLEDRSRRNNIKIRGIPETVKPPDLNAYFQNILQEMLPDATVTDLSIDRIHRLPKPKHLPDHLPRDTIARIHFYQTKEKFLQCMRKPDNALPCIQGLSFFTDLSAYTMQRRKNLATITKPLKNHHIAYRWAYPAKLLITKDGKTFPVQTVEDGIWLLKDWDILDKAEDPPSSASSPRPHSLAWPQDAID